MIKSCSEATLLSRNANCPHSGSGCARRSKQNIQTVPADSEVRKNTHDTGFHRRSLSLPDLTSYSVRNTDFSVSYLHKIARHSQSQSLESTHSSRSSTPAAEDGRFDEISNIMARTINDDLLQAASEGETEKVHRLLNAGANPEYVHTGGYRNTPLALAARAGHAETVSALLEPQIGADIESRNFYGDTPLGQAAMGGHTKTVLALLTAGANHHHPNCDYLGPLELAAKYGRTETVLTLLKAGAKVNRANALGQAAQHGHTETIITLLKAGAKVNRVNSMGVQPLGMAAMGGHSEAVKALLAANADLEYVSVTSELDNTALGHAAYRGHTEVLKILLEANANMEYSDGHGFTPLLSAVRNNHVKASRLLLDAGANVGRTNHIGQTVLHLAVMNNNLLMTKILLSSDGIDVNAIASGGNTALHLAVTEKDYVIYQMLIAAGADPSIKNNGQKTAQDLAGKETDSNWLEWALSYFYPPQRVDARYYLEMQGKMLDILRNAREGKNIAKAIKSLLEEYDARNHSMYLGVSLLQLAVLCQNPAVLSALVIKGTEPSSRDGWRKTPLEMAIDTGDHDAVNILAPVLIAEKSSLPEESEPDNKLLSFSEPLDQVPILSLKAWAAHSVRSAYSLQECDFLVGKFPNSVTKQIFGIFPQ